MQIKKITVARVLTSNIIILRLWCPYRRLLTFKIWIKLARCKNCQRTNIFKIEHKEKAVIYTWLAWQKKAGSSLGGAVSAQFSENEKQYYLLDNEKTSDFRKWLQDMFKN